MLERSLAGSALGGGSACAKATFGKGLNAGAGGETSPGGSTCFLGEATGSCEAILGETAGAK